MGLFKSQAQKDGEALCKTLSRSPCDEKRALALIEGGADLGATLSGGTLSPLHLAIDRGLDSIAHALLDAGAPLDSNSCNGTPLHAAAGKGNAGIVRRLLDMGAEVNAGREDDLWRTPMQEAVWSDRSLDILRMLHAAGGDAKNTNVLRAAARSGKIDVVSWLLEQGANATAALYTAVKEKNNPMLRLLMRRGAGGKSDNFIDALNHAASEVNTDALRILLGDDPAADSETWTPLLPDKIARVEHLAALHRRVTDVFNFSACERQVFVENLRTGQDSAAPPVSFDSVSPPVLEKALKRFHAAGGDAGDLRLPGTVKKPRI